LRGSYLRGFEFARRSSVNSSATNIYCQVSPKITNIYWSLDREISVICRHFSPHRADGSTIGVKIGQKSHLSEKFQGFACASWNDFHFQFCLHFNFPMQFFFLLSFQKSCNFVILLFRMIFSL